MDWVLLVSQPTGVLVGLDGDGDGLEVRKQPELITKFCNNF